MGMRCPGRACPYQRASAAELWHGATDRGLTWRPRCWGDDQKSPVARFAVAAQRPTWRLQTGTRKAAATEPISPCKVTHGQGNLRRRVAELHKGETRFEQCCGLWSICRNRCSRVMPSKTVDMRRDQTHADAWLHYISAVRARLLAVASQIVGADDAEDVVQECALYLWLHPPAPEKMHLGYLIKVTNNRAKRWASQHRCGRSNFWGDARIVGSVPYVSRHSRRR